MPELTSHEQENKEFIEWLDSKPSSLELALKRIQLILELNDLQDGIADKAWATRRKLDPRTSTPAGSGARFTPERIQKYRDDAINYGELTADDVNTILDEVEYLHFNMDGLAIGLKLAAVGKEIDKRRIALLEEKAGCSGSGCSHPS